MGLINVGIAKIEIGDIAEDGGMSKDLKKIGYTTEDSAQINMDDPETTEFPVEEIDTPVYESSKQGGINFVWQVADPDEETLAEVFGGKKSGSDDDVVYKFPDSSPEIERSLKVTPKKGMGLDFARVKISAKFTTNVGRNNLLGVEINAKVLQPEKEDEPKLATFRVS